MIKTHFNEDCRVHQSHKISTIVNGIVITGKIDSVYEDVVTLSDVTLSMGSTEKRFNNYNIDSDQVVGWTIMEKESTFNNLKQLR